MDGQMKRGLPEVCVLTGLARGDSCGYPIIRDIDPCIRISESTLYPIWKQPEAWNITADCGNTISSRRPGGNAGANF